MESNQPKPNKETLAHFKAEYVVFELHILIAKISDTRAFPKKERQTLRNMCHFTIHCITTNTLLPYEKKILEGFQELNAKNNEGGTIKDQAI
jgi:hypothetical protein